MFLRAGISISQKASACTRHIHIKSHIHKQLTQKSLDNRGNILNLECNVTFASSVLFSERFKSVSARLRLSGSCPQLAVALQFLDPLCNDVTANLLAATLSELSESAATGDQATCLLIHQPSIAHTCSTSTLAIPRDLNRWMFHAPHISPETSQHRHTAPARLHTSLAFIFKNRFLFLFILPANRSFKLIFNVRTGRLARWLNHWDTCFPTNRVTRSFKDWETDLLSDCLIEGLGYCLQECSTGCQTGSLNDAVF